MPSWDEPDYKATFDLTARVPANQMAVGNMPAAASSKDVGDGLKAVTFQTTPVMSSYLLFFATGDFDRITKQAGDREVGVVMSRGNGDKARYALDAEAQILPYYNDYFGTPYPLPKLDNVAGPGQSQFFGAMENWGAIFTFERLAAGRSGDHQRGATSRTIFGTEAHEMAHMWFGDLVTMAWWDDLWLNEGFASWMANKTTQHFHPDWGADVDQVGGARGSDGARFLRDHPPDRPVHPHRRAGQPGVRRHHLREGRVGDLDARRLCRRRTCGGRASATTSPSSPTRIRAPADLWAAVEGAGAKGLIADRARFHHPARHSAGPARRVALRQRTDRLRR